MMCVPTWHLAKSFDLSTISHHLGEINLARCLWALSALCLCSSRFCLLRMSLCVLERELSKRLGYHSGWSTVVLKVTSTRENSKLSMTALA
jgi:hypothetical protein